jgi:D-tyrosyl-tRNA(Tyr) deacylase
MITIIQRVIQASVTVNNKVVGEIEHGILALVAVEKEDTEQQATRLLERVLNYRIFSDENDRMNLSLRDTGGGLLLVPQFTLAANTEKGNRPSFASAAAPEQGRQLFQFLSDRAKHSYHTIACGQFGADMKVALINDGPVTFTLRTRPTNHHPDHRHKVEL